MLYTLRAGHLGSPGQAGWVEVCVLQPATLRGGQAPGKQAFPLQYWLFTPGLPRCLPLNYSGNPGKMTYLTGVQTGNARDIPFQTGCLPLKYSGSLGVNGLQGCKRETLGVGELAAVDPLE